MLYTSVPGCDPASRGWAPATGTDTGSESELPKRVLVLRHQTRAKIIARSMYDSDEIIRLHLAAAKQGGSANAHIRDSSQMDDLLVQRRLRMVRCTHYIAGLLTRSAD